MACLHSRKATVSTDSLSHVHAGDGGTNMTETIYTIVQELTSVAVFLTECYDPPSRMPCGLMIVKLVHSVTL